MIAIDALAYASKIRAVNPKAKIFLSGLPLILCIAFDDFSVSIITVIAMAYLTTKYSGVSLGVFYKFMTIPLVFLLLGAVAVTIGRFPLGAGLIVGVNIGAYSYGMSDETLMTGIGLALRSFACLSCLYFFSFNTPMSDFFSLLEKTRTPKIIISLAELIYRYIFILLDEAERIGIAQRSRLGYGSFKSSIYCLSLLAGSLFIRAYARAERASNALESRNFDGNTVFEEDSYENGRQFYIIACLLILLLIVAGIAETLSGIYE